VRKKLKITHLTLLDAIVESTRKGNTGFKLESKFIADKVIANFLGQYNEWRYMNRTGFIEDGNSVKLSKKNQVTLDLSNGEVEIGIGSVLSSIIAAWAYFIIIFLSTFTFKKSAQKKFIFFFSLTKEQIYKNGQVTEFSQFIHQERFSFNQDSESDVYLVECRNKRFFRIHNKDVIITRNIPLYVFRNSLVFRAKIPVLAASLKAAIMLTVMLPTCNWLFLFIKEIVLEEPIFRLTDASSNLEYKLITTQSHLFTRPLIFYRQSKFLRSMIWYSSNSHQILRIGDEYEDFERTQFETLEIDIHYVWSKAQADFIKDRNAREISIKVVGSIIFQPINKLEKKKLNSGSIQITYFDVTPTNYWYNQNGFYSEANMLSILFAIVKVIREIENQTSTRIVLRLKPKREFKEGHHSDRYKSIVDSLVSSAEIECIDSSVDLYALINESDIVIAVPFSSPCLVANEMGVPTAYFSPNSDFNIVNPEGEINLLLSERELKKFILSCL